MYAFRVMKVSLMAMSLTYVFGCAFFYMSHHNIEADLGIDHLSYYYVYKMEDKSTW